MFCDASLEGYGIVAYDWFIRGRGEIDVAMVFARAYVVPLNLSIQTMKDEETHDGSVPHLELTACRTGAKMAGVLSRDSDEPYHRMVFWTDSECVLKWLL